MEEPLILYECSLCHVYLENYTKATIHLGMKHSEACRLKNNVIKSFKNQNGLTGQGQGQTDNDEDLIKSREFPESTVLLQRTTSKKIETMSTYCSQDTQEVKGSKTTTTITRKIRAKGRKHSRRNEIKLDTLKAGEIETLITDLFNNASTSSTTNLEPGQTIFQRSRRKVKENFNSNYGELDSEDEEVIKTGVAGGSKRSLRNKIKLRQDADYNPSDDDSSSSALVQIVQKKVGGVPAPGKTRYLFQDDLDKQMKIKGMTYPKDLNEPHECPVCNMRFSRRSGLHRHFIWHVENNPFKCDFPGCEKTFDSNYRLKTHIVLHDGHKNLAGSSLNWRCRICDLQFPNHRTKYLIHMKTEHMKSGKYSCPTCQKDFDFLKKFNKHLDMHIDNIYPRRLGLKKYVIATEKVECKICGKIVTNTKYADGLARHMKTHELKSVEDPNKPFECPVCHHRFVNKLGLRRHFILHLENNPFKCQFLGCGKTFNSDFNLKRHIAMHTDRVFYKCNICPAKYSRKERLKQHIKKFHSENSKQIYRFKSSTVYNKSIHDLAPEIPNLTTTKTHPDKRSENDEDSRFEVESVHLTDKIITMDDQDIHIKGEHLSPRKREIDDSGDPSTSPRRGSRSPSPSEEVGGDGEHTNSTESKLPESSLELYRIMESDPTVRRIKEKDPDVLKSVILGQRYFYNNTRKNESFKCQMCSWSGKMSHWFQKHMQKHHGVLPDLPFTVEPTSDNPLAISLTCGSCGFQSKTSEELSVHISDVHVRDKKYYCSYCGRRYADLSLRDKHIKRAHLMEKKFKCDKCKAKYNTPRQLTQHFSQKHDPVYQKELKQTCKCKECGLVLCNLKSLAAHMKRHTHPQKEVVSCRICGQNCAAKEVLKRHIRYVHFGVPNPYRKKSTKYRLNRSNNKPHPIETQVNAGEEAQPSTGSGTQETELDNTGQTLTKSTVSSDVPVNLTDVCNNDVDRSEILGL